MSHELPADWRNRIEGIMADQIEALHVFEVLKKELPSQMHGGEAEREILRILIGKPGGAR